MIRLQTSATLRARQTFHADEVPQALIQIDGLTKVFYTDEVETHALSGVHLSVAKGEYVAMSGPSGCGKSTLLSIIGLLDTPSSRPLFTQRQNRLRISISPSVRAFATRRSDSSSRAST